MLHAHVIERAKLSIIKQSMLSKDERIQSRLEEEELIRQVKQGAPLEILAKFWNDKKELMLARVQRRYERIEMAKTEGMI